MEDPKPSVPSLPELLAAERELLREQVSAAWQLHVDSVLERLESGWRTHVAGALERRFAGLEEQLTTQIERISSEKSAEAEPKIRASVRQVLTGELSQAGRRLEQAEDTAAWAAALLDGAKPYAPCAALLEITGERARLIAARPAEETAPEWSALKPWPPLLQGAADVQDTVIALASPTEIGEALHALLRPAPSARAIVVPVVAGRTDGRRRTAALLLAFEAGESFDPGGLELLATLAGTALDCRLAAQRSTTAAPAGALMGIAPSPAGTATGAAPWREEELHARAQRFARVKIAEIRLYHPEAVLQGRAAGNLYAALEAEINRAREEYAEQFGAIAPPVDYFHEEIVRTLAHDDTSLLGPGYPGPRV